MYSFRLEPALNKSFDKFTYSFSTFSQMVNSTSGTIDVVTTTSSRLVLEHETNRMAKIIFFINLLTICLISF